MRHYIVKTPSSGYVLDAHLSTARAATLNFVGRRDDAHLFENRGAAEAIAFLCNGTVEIQ